MNSGCSYSLGQRTGDSNPDESWTSRLQRGPVLRCGFWHNFCAFSVLFGLYLCQGAFAAGFNPHLSYYNHTADDTTALQNKYGSSTIFTSTDDSPSSMRTTIVTSGSTVRPGDYIHILAGGTIKIGSGSATSFNAAGVFADGIKIRGWTGHGNRFTQTGTSPLPARVLKVAGIPTNTNEVTEGSNTNAHNAPSQSFGVDVTQDPVSDFRIGSSAGPGIIVKVPATTTGNVYLFKSVIESGGFSRITDVNSTIAFGKVDPTSGRPRFYLADNRIYEGETRGLTIGRQYANQFPVKVKYTLYATGPAGSNSADSADISIPTQSGTLDFPSGSDYQATAPITINRDGTYEGDESFSIKLEVIQGDNPNEAYVESNGTDSFTYPVTVLDTDGVPAVHFPASPDANSGPFAGSTHNEPASESPIYVPVQLSRPSKFWTAVWYNADPGDVGNVVSGVPAVDGPDFVFNNMPDNRYIVVPAGETFGQIPIYLRGDAVYEGPEKIVLHLGVDGSRGYTDLNWTPVANGISGRHVITIADSSPAPTASVTLDSPADADRAEPDNVSGSNQTRTIRVSLSGLSANATSISLAFAGTASQPSDYSVPATSVTIPAGQLTATLNVTIPDDRLLEFDEVITVALAPAPPGGYPGYQAGQQSSVRMIIRDNDGGEGHAAQIVPSPAPPVPAATASIAMRVDNSLADFAVAVWRIRGEPLWRLADNPTTTSTLEGAATGLVPGIHEIEFRSFDGWISPPPMMVEVSANQTWIPAAGSMPGYIRTGTSSPGTSLTVITSISGGGWKLEGEVGWRSSGTTVSGFPRGIYRIFYRPVAGYALPTETVVSFSSAPVKTVSKNYVTETVVPGWPFSSPAFGSLADSYISNDPKESTVFVGRITSSAGSGTGCAAQVNTVLTCAHVLFDDATLSFSTNVRWHHQAQRGFLQPAAAVSSEYTGVLNSAGSLTHVSGMVPRGWLVMGGYAAKRLEYLQANGIEGFSTPDSQNLDVATAYFAKPVARGFKVGMLIRGTGESPGRWLQAGTTESPVDKRLIGYPYENVPHDELGRVFRRTYSQGNNNYSSFTLVHAQDNVFNSYNIVAGGGMSGAPVMIQTSTDVWKVCGVYLGSNAGTNYGVMRELDDAVGTLITQAQGMAGDGNTTGGGKSFASTLEDDGLNQGRVSFRANVGGAGWRTLGRLSYRACASAQRAGDPLDVPSGETVPVEFSKLSGWTEPAVMLVQAAPGDEQEVQVVYTALTFKAIQGQLAAAGASASQQVAAADFDGDGISNFLEWAFNLDPTRRDAATLAPATGDKGMPFVRMVGQGSSRRLRVEFLRMKNAGLHYEAQFASTLAAGDWSATAGSVIAVSDIDANWQRVVVEDSLEGQPRRFARVKVVGN